MPSRRAGRAVALQILYQADWAEDMRPEDAKAFAQGALQEYREELAPVGFENDPEMAAFITDLVSGVLSMRNRLDEIIRRFSKGWKIERMAMVDRNILRLGVFELCFLPEIPPRVAINEAIELAKRFGDVNSTGFVNGILDSVYQKVCREKLAA
jgi:N utilization substance protein B